MVNRNLNLGKDKTILEIMGEELQAKFPKLKYYLMMEREELSRVVKGIVTKVGKAKVVEHLDQCDVVILDTLDPKVNAKEADCVFKKPCVNLKFIFDFYFGCKAVDVQSYGIPLRQDARVSGR